ncbi:MAG: hypothetical protein WDW38_006681 [Sanguina aurantia]
MPVAPATAPAVTATVEQQLCKNALMRFPECPVCLEMLTPKTVLYLNCALPFEDPGHAPVHVLCKQCWGELPSKICPVPLAFIPPFFQLLLRRSFPQQPPEHQRHHQQQQQQQPHVAVR